MKLTKQIIVITIMLLQMSMANQVRSEQINTDGLLNKLEATLKDYTNIRTKAQTMTMAIDTQRGNMPVWFKENTDFRYDGDRYDIIREQWFNLDSEDAPTLPGNGQSYRQFWDGENIFDHWFFEDGDMKKVSYNKIVVSRDEDMYGNNVPYDVGAPLLGIFNGDLRPVTEILRESDRLSLRPNTEVVNGSSCYVIEASGKHGKYTVWVDPEHSYNIAKAKVSKTGKAMAYGALLGTMDDFDEEIQRERHALTEMSFEIDNVRFEEINGKWIPVEADFDTIIERDHKHITHDKRHHKRTLVDLEPDFEAIGAFAADLPNKTKIVVPEAAGVIYMWQDGEIVPHIDNFVVDSIDYVIEEEKGVPKAAFADLVTEEQVITEEAKSKDTTNTAEEDKAPQQNAPIGTTYLPTAKGLLIILLSAGVILTFYYIRVKARRENHG
jgi:hypothetical protein